MDKINFYAQEFDEERFIQQLLLIAFRFRANFYCNRYLYDKEGNYKNVEVNISKRYDQIKSEDEYLQIYTGNDPFALKEYKGQKISCLGRTVSGTKSEHLALELCIEYLKLDPSYIISSGDDYFFTLKHLLKAREKGEYFWCYKNPEELLG